MKFNKYLAILKEKLYSSIGFPFSNVINDDIIQQTPKDEQIEYRERLSSLSSKTDWAISGIL